MGSNGARGRKGRAGYGNHRRLRRDYRLRSLPKGLSQDQDHASHRRRNRPYAAYFGGAARGQISRRRLQRWRKFAVSNSLQRENARSDQAGADPTGSHRLRQMVGGQAEVRRQRGTVYFRLRRQCIGGRRRGIQHSIDRSARIQNLLGFAESQAQGKDRLHGYSQGARSGDSLAVSLLSYRSRTEVSAPLVRRDGCDAGGGPAPGHRLVGYRQVHRGYADPRGNRFQSEEPGAAGG